MTPIRERGVRWLARAVIVSVATATVLVGAVSTAAADVVVNPTEEIQGAAAKLSFLIVNEGATAPIVKVDMLLPAEAPIAEVYPLSAEDWAPSMTMRTLATPLQSLHGPLITEAVASVTWTAVEGRALPPGQTAELILSVGPLPEVERLAIEVVVTDSLGTVVRSAPAIALRPEAAPAPPTPEKTAEESNYLPWTIAFLAAVSLVTMWRLWARRRRGAALTAELEAEPETEVSHTLVHH